MELGWNPALSHLKPLSLRLCHGPASHCQRLGLCWWQGAGAFLVGGRRLPMSRCQGSGERLLPFNKMQLLLRGWAMTAFVRHMMAGRPVSSPEGAARPSFMTTLWAAKEAQRAGERARVACVCCGQPRRASWLHAPVLLPHPEPQRAWGGAETSPSRSSSHVFLSLCFSPPSADAREESGWLCEVVPLVPCPEVPSKSGLEVGLSSAHLSSSLGLPLPF